MVVKYLSQIADAHTLFQIFFFSMLEVNLAQVKGPSVELPVKKRTSLSIILKTIPHTKQNNNNSSHNGTQANHVLTTALRFRRMFRRLYVCGLCKGPFGNFFG